MSTDMSTYKMNHTMLRVKDLKKSLEFYCDILGMKQIDQWVFEENKFSLTFLAFDGDNALHHGVERTKRQGILELTHNFGTENEEGPVYKNGNDDQSRGFGHICISVDNIEDACAYFESKGVTFQKRLTDGRMKNIAFIRDPDNYWIELINQSKKTPSFNKANTRFNHTMIRAKDPKASLAFYEKLGLQLIDKSDYPEAKFSLYFLAYPADIARGDREGILELTHNWGTEEQEGPVYKNGNDDESRGFGHVCISVDNIEAAAEKFEKDKLNFKKRLTDGRMKDIMFLLDPDNYWVEVIGQK
ncbi:glyoxalase I [Schizosaccharomyces japonicus yFS275]|uniref:Lactoylglutathione lyase n=1 Tax=Schizosaccharomyces japonicus (strain yFS275 / FY16936) TaxID=402676 RepID=B6K7L2_SCHJY|nr:glyoxalase I [Schizosaccharomyces japonicus yFS275]EEB09516.1 glyoxalase I [Schizosaccharomyces japonicus yFS275]